MIKNIIIFLYINVTYQKLAKTGVYNIINNDLYLMKNGINIKLSSKYVYPNTFFRIVKSDTKYNDIFYYIEEIQMNNKLSISKNNELILHNQINNSELWKFVKINENDYLIENYNHCFIKINNEKIICDNIPPSKETFFQLDKIYVENSKLAPNHYKSRILNKEPVDVLIKYIDLNDPDLKRNGIHQIEKDIDNEELRYSIRSIFQNIPWIRKIFILMPNERVRYLKDYNLINDKIIYIKDKDLLGYESSNSLAFQYRYWKMKNFGISDNIIVMDDDCFIGGKLNKSDFFYVEKGKVVPLIITSNILKIEKENIQQNLKIYEKKARLTKEEQNDDIFLYSKYLTYNFIFNLFNKTTNNTLFLPFYTHNAIPVNLKELKEVYELVYESKYKTTTLDWPFRHYEYLHFQILLISYTFIKYNKKVNHIPHNYIQLNKSISSNYKYSLFCINKIPGNYSLLNLYKAKIIMEYLFPIPSPFEINNNSFYDLSFRFAYLMDKLEKEYEAKLSHMISKKEVLSLILNIIILFVVIISKIIKIFHFTND